MKFLFSLLKIKGLYTFRALLTHLQESLHKRHLVFYVLPGLEWNCTSSTPTLVAGNWHNTHTQYTKYRLCNTSWGWASNARNMSRPLILNKMNKCITLVSLYWHTVMHGQSLYWYTVMHGQSLYWYTVMHGQSLDWYTVMHGQSLYWHTVMQNIK
jgi:hypothetical protein